MWGRYVFAVLIPVIWLASCDGLQRKHANPYERELALRATGNCVSSFKAPEAPEELWRVEVDGFMNSAVDVVGSVRASKLCQDGVLGVDICVLDPTEPITFDSKHYYVLVKDRAVVGGCFVPTKEEYNGNEAATLIPSAPPMILTGLAFGRSKNSAAAGSIQESSSGYFRLAAYDFSPAQLWEKTCDAYSDSENPTWFYANAQVTTLYRDRLYSEGFSSSWKECYLAFSLQGELIWKYEYPTESTYWGGVESFTVMHPALSSDEVLYISGTSKVLAIDRTGKLVAEYDRNMQCGREEPKIGLDGMIYLVAQKTPTEEAVNQISDEPWDKYDLRWRQDQYLLVMDDQLVEERRSIITEGWQHLVCIDAQGNYTMYLNSKSKKRSSIDGPYRADIVRYSKLDIEQWRYEISGIAVCGSLFLNARLDVTGRLLVLDAGTLICLSPDGEELWRYTADRELQDFVIGGDRLIYCIADSVAKIPEKAGVGQELTDTSGVMVYAIGEPSATP